VRILHVSEVHWGGVVSLLQHFTSIQAQHGDEVHVLASRRMPRLPGSEMHDWALSRDRPRTYPIAWLQLRQCIREVQPDVVHLHSFMAGFFGRLPRTVPRGRPVVYQPHAWAFDLFDEPKRSAVIAWERHANKRTSAIVANCLDELREGEACGIRNEGFPIGIAVDTDFFRPPSDAERIDAKRKVGYRTRPLLLVLGRLAYQKAQDLIVSEWESRPLECADLVLVGPGEPTDLRQRAPREWSRSVHFEGESSDVRTWLWAADLLLIPSRYETVSLVAGEALSVGLPVVATRFNGASEAIVEGGAPGGAVVERDDMRALFDRASDRLSDRSLWHAESQNARERATSMFSPLDVHDRLNSGYMKVAASEGLSR
jgi:glycosyltransferase involved in cell wall biosynthesis